MDRDGENIVLSLHESTASYELSKKNSNKIAITIDDSHKFSAFIEEPSEMHIINFPPGALTTGLPLYLKNGKPLYV